MLSVVACAGGVLSCCVVVTWREETPPGNKGVARPGGLVPFHHRGNKRSVSRRPVQVVCVVVVSCVWCYVVALGYDGSYRVCVRARG